MSLASVLRGRAARLCGEALSAAGGRRYHVGAPSRSSQAPAGGDSGGEPVHGHSEGGSSHSFWGGKPKSMTKTEFARRVAQLLREEPKKPRDVWGERPMTMTKEEFRSRLYLWREGKLPAGEGDDKARAEVPVVAEPEGEKQPPKKPPE